jgi:hypothetical protein
MDGILQIDIASPNFYDELAVGGTFDIDQDAVININGFTDLALIDFVALGFEIGNRVDLVTASQISGNFFNFPENEFRTTPGGLLMFFGNDGSSIYLLATPEPTAATLWVLLALVSLVLSRRRWCAAVVRKEVHGN